VQHGAADAGVLVRAGRAVGPAAEAELNFAFVEVFLEFLPFDISYQRILMVRPQRSSVGHVHLVVADHVLVEHRKVAPADLEARMS
jgi:hypothetical protein